MMEQQFETIEDNFTQNAEENHVPFSHATQTQTSKSSHVSRSQSRHSFSDDTQVAVK